MNKYLQPKKYVGRLKYIFSLRSYKKSYSQNGEDLIMNFICNVLDLQKPNYIDIGAHHPRKINNTLLFYTRGSRGINIEPNPSLFKKFLSLRKRDLNLNIGIADSTMESLPFYIFKDSTLSTFSKEEAEHISDIKNTAPIEIKSVSVMSINSLIQKYNNGLAPDILSIDTEGLDYIILKSLDLKKYRPKIICVETISYDEKSGGQKDIELIDFLKQENYLVVADTYINTIFVDKALWGKK